MMVKICILIPLLLFDSSMCGHHLKVTYYTHFNKMTWRNAQAFCREHYTDLVTVRNEQENGLFVDFGWIGLYRENGSPWKWSRRDEITDFRNWEPDEPNPYGDCVWKYLGEWRTSNCDEDRYFTCFNEILVLVKENKTWEEALDYCRSLDTDDPASSYWNHSYDLATLITPDDRTYARDKAQEATTDEVWTGLCNLAGEWLWVGGEQMQYKNIPSCPTDRFCGVLEKNGTASFGLRDCQLRMNFFCYKKP